MHVFTRTNITISNTLHKSICLILKIDYHVSKIIASDFSLPEIVRTKDISNVCDWNYSHMHVDID